MSRTVQIPESLFQILCMYFESSEPPEWMYDECKHGLEEKYESYKRRLEYRIEHIEKNP